MLTIVRSRNPQSAFAPTSMQLLNMFTQKLCKGFVILFIELELKTEAGSGALGDAYNGQRIVW